LRFSETSCDSHGAPSAQLSKRVQAGDWDRGQSFLAGRSLRYAAHRRMDRALRLQPCFCAAVSGVARGADGSQVTRALRRAVISRAQQEWGAGVRLPALISGHQADGTPATGHEHLHYLFDRPSQRALLLAAQGPRTVDTLVRLRAALRGFNRLKAGAAGVLELKPLAFDAKDDPLLGRSSVWQNRTPYAVNHHRRLGSAYAAVRADLEAACRYEGLPAVQVRVLRCGSGARGLTAFAELSFAAELNGPLVLGQTRHLGGGLFECRLPPAVSAS